MKRSERLRTATSFVFASLLKLKRYPEMARFVFVLADERGAALNLRRKPTSRPLASLQITYRLPPSNNPAKTGRGNKELNQSFNCCIQGPLF